MTSVVWVAPNLNHYKARLLHGLSQSGIQLHVLSGSISPSEGHIAGSDQGSFSHLSIPVGKSSFARSRSSYSALRAMVDDINPDVVLMPLEKKFLPIILFLAMLRGKRGFKLVSYNHPVTKSRLFGSGWVEIMVMKSMCKLYDRIVFYTESAMQRAVAGDIVSHEKAAFANNTLDTQAIWSTYSFQFPESGNPAIVFIGRLVKRKRIADLFDYFACIRTQVPDCRLIVIGDGPESALVQEQATTCSAVDWIGATGDEETIEKHMRSARLVFVPGASGLSIVHSFCYGRPYATLADSVPHGPEIDYLVHEENGFLLSGDRALDCEAIVSVLSDENRLHAMCSAAFDTAKRLRIEDWCAQMKDALTFAARPQLGAA